MKLQHIIDSVRYGELTNISWDNKNRIPAIISFINQGLTDLYSRFPLMEKQLIIQQYPQISIYRLTRDFARTNFKSEQLHKYILDTPFEPFQEDILQISGVLIILGPISYLLITLYRYLMLMRMKLHSLHIKLSIDISPLLLKI